MCGITCIIAENSSAARTPEIEQNVKNRGPDSFNEILIPLGDKLEGYFAASVLHTQGTELTKQPVFVNNNVFLWNGDIFDGYFTRFEGGNSDTDLLSKWLDENDGDVIKLVSLIEGPYSFVYYNSDQRCLWFARDPLGRHSLLWSVTGDRVHITSVAHKHTDDFAEVPAVGVFSVHFDDVKVTDICVHPWSHSNLSELPDRIRISDETISYFDFPHHGSENTEFFPPEQTMEDMLSAPVIAIRVNELLDLITESVRKRVTIQRNTCKECSTPSACTRDHCKVGVLFSGGLDSTVIARIADKFVPEDEPIDLLNVAFCRNGVYTAPDRVTGLASVQALRTLCPSRNWNFVEINVTEAELRQRRDEHICHLIHPLKTVLDDSLGCALWFASRGEGCVNGVPYVSPAKVILMGNGADEQLGGYMRHRNLLKRNGWKELGEQLLKETLDISKRNLGRDDRVASDHGRQPRFPFLDENFVKYVAGLPPWQRCDPVSFVPGFGNKLILRLTAAKLGLKECATFPKRAFQFGSRIAKSKEKGDNFSERL